MSGPSATADAPAPSVPEGFFDEIATLLEDESAAQIADSVISVCTRRGILHPELEENPEDELRTEEIREVFDLLAAVTLAVTDGTIAPTGVRVDRADEMDPDMAQAWESFVEAAADPEAAAAAAAMLDKGKVQLPGTAVGAAAAGRGK